MKLTIPHVLAVNHLSATEANEPFVFHPSAAQSRGNDGDRVVEQTRREISEIVRELAATSRQEITIGQYTSILCDRTLRAMSAEGVVIWKNTGLSATDTLQMHPIARLGRITDRSIPDDGVTPHQSLLSLVATDAAPVVVPATPGANDPDVPANPTNFPAALVPIDVGNASSPIYLIEVFLDPEGGVAIQRGYLRFVCQVADLAGEYFRSEQLRTLMWQQDLAEKIDHAISSFHRVDQTDSLIALLVDIVADIFSLDRVAFCQIDLANQSRKTKKRKNRLIAVSHVDSIDHQSPAVQRILKFAEDKTSSNQTNWFANDPAFPTDLTKAPEAVSQQNVVEQQKETGDSDGEIAVALDPVFALIAKPTGTSSADAGYRLLGYRRCNDDGTSQSGLQSFQQKELCRLAEHASMGLDRIDASQSSLIANLLRRKSSGVCQTAPTWKTAVKRVAVVTIIATVMIVPVPKNIEATATVRAENTQRICAVRDAVVQSISVKHGQEVSPDQVLMTLSDPGLEQQLITLSGRRAVLAEQQTMLTETLVDASSRDFKNFENVQSQRSIVDEELASITNQLDLLYQIKQTLVIRSDREGTIDAWQINERFRGRPVQRGEQLMQVISKDSPWLVDAKVPQRRINGIRRVHKSGDLSAAVSIDDEPTALHQASIVQFGPTLSNKSSISTGGDEAKAAVLLEIQPSSEPNSSRGALPTSTPTASRSGTAATVIFRCGSVPLADLLFGDLYRDMQNRIALHWGVDDSLPQVEPDRAPNEVRQALHQHQSHQDTPNDGLKL